MNSFPRGPALALLGMITLVLMTGSIWLTRTRPYFPKHSEEFKGAQDILEVISQAQSRLSGNPEDLKALIELGMAHFQQGSGLYVEAANAFEKARDFGAMDARIFYYLGVCYEGLGLAPYALLEYERYLRNCPSDVETRIRVANILFQDKRYDQAIAHYEQCREALPKEDPVVLVNLGLAYQENKQPEEAMAMLERAKRITEGRLPIGVDTRLGQLYAQKTMWEEALACFQEEVRHNPTHGPAHEGLAIAYETKAMMMEAASAWKRVLELDPKNKTAKKKANALMNKK